MKLVEANSFSVKSGRETLLKDISFSVREGEVIAICGGPASGKTTLCKSIKGILPQNLQTLGSLETEGKIGYMFQNPEKQLVRKTVRRDLAFGLENEGLCSSEINERIDRYSKLFDMEDLLNRDVNKLSSGQKAKVAILGSILSRPETVVLDEPLAGLDADNKEIVLDQIERLKRQDKTLIIAEHDLRGLFPEIDRVIILRDGEILLEGKTQEMAPILKSEGMKLPYELEFGPEAGESS